MNFNKFINCVLEGRQQPIEALLFHCIQIELEF